MEKIQSGNLILDKRREETILKYPQDYLKPIAKSTDVFAPSRRYFIKSY